MSETEGKKAASSWLNVAVDYGPLLVFLGVYRWMSPDEVSAAGEVIAIIYGTGAFMAASVVALLVSKWRLGKVSPMLWFSTALIVGFGSLTIFFGDPTFVQLKPTIIYASFGVVLLGGFFAGKALLRILLEAAFEGLSEQGWLKLSRNWGGVLPMPCRPQRGLARTNGFRGVAMGQAVGLPAADLPVHLQPDSDAAEGRVKLRGPGRTAEGRTADGGLDLHLASQFHHAVGRQIEKVHCAC